MDPVEPGLACGSDTAHMSIFGYDPRSFYRGRGAFESMGAGIPMQVQGGRGAGDPMQLQGCKGGDLVMP